MKTSPNTVRVLTPQQERFAQLVASGKSQAGAYREAYPKSQKWQPAAVHEKASHLMAIGKVKARVEELRKPAVEAARLTLESHLSDLAALREEARSAGKFESAVKAEELRGKASGFYVERKEEGPPGAFTESREVIEARIRERNVRLGLAKVIPIKGEQGNMARDPISNATGKGA